MYQTSNNTVSRSEALLHWLNCSSFQQATVWCGDKLKEDTFLNIVKKINFILLLSLQWGWEEEVTAVDKVNQFLNKLHGVERISTKNLINNGASIKNEVIVKKVHRFCHCRLLLGSEGVFGPRNGFYIIYGIRLNKWILCCEC